MLKVSPWNIVLIALDCFCHSTQIYVNVLFFNMSATDASNAFPTDTHKREQKQVRRTHANSLDPTKQVVVTRTATFVGENTRIALFDCA